MKRTPVTPVFVDRKTAAELLMISVDTFDTWLRAGFIPPANIDRGQIVRWHWPTVESHLLGAGTDMQEDPSVLGVRLMAAKRSDPFIEGLKNVRKGRRRE